MFKFIDYNFIGVVGASKMDPKNLTENAGGVTVAQGWIISPQNFLIANVAPPKDYGNIDLIEKLQNWQPLILSKLFETSKVNNVKNEHHDQLLEQSLQEHEGIWEALAQI